MIFWGNKQILGFTDKLKFLYSKFIWGASSQTVWISLVALARSFSIIFSLNSKPSSITFIIVFLLLSLGKELFIILIKSPHLTHILG